jgi:radical SAM superfamily enzyme YgiQ (UPF0313 family)
MKILLIFAPYSRLKQPHPNEFPLGLGYLAAVLRQQGYRAEIADLTVRTPDINQLRNLFRSSRPDVVGVSAMTENYRQALWVARVARKTLKDVKIVMGGVHATFQYSEVLRECPEIDVIVVGEGEKTMLELTETLDKGLDQSRISEIPGLALRRKDEILLTAPREKIQNLDELPYPAFDLLVHPELKDYFEEETRRLPLITSRGCPYECVFCSTSKMHGRKYRARTPENVVDEIAYDIKKYQVNGINFVDDLFTLNHQRTTKICQEIIERKIEIKWGCLSRVDCITPELLKIMKQAGCTGIFYGIESLSNNVLRKVKKGFTYKEIKQAINWTTKEELDVDASFILGLPGETPESLQLIPRFVTETGINRRVLTNMLQILPGTELHTNPEKFNLEITENEFLYWTHIRSHVKELTKQDILKALLEITSSLHENRYGDEGLFEVEKPDIEITDETTLHELTSTPT